MAIPSPTRHCATSASYTPPKPSCATWTIRPAGLSGPWLAAFKAWLDAQQAQTLGNSGVRKAIDYTLRRWSVLARVIDHGAFPIDNNPIENAIRPIALGRKNWLFAGSQTAGQRAAAIMSLLATAKANGLEPHAWLTDVLARLPTTKAATTNRCCPWHSQSLRG